MAKFAILPWYPGVMPRTQTRDSMDKVDLSLFSDSLIWDQKKIIQT